jgi:hypothetical protein
MIAGFQLSIVEGVDDRAAHYLRTADAQPSNNLPARRSMAHGGATNGRRLHATGRMLPRGSQSVIELLRHLLCSLPPPRSILAPGCMQDPAAAGRASRCRSRAAPTRQLSAWMQTATWNACPTMAARPAFGRPTRAAKPWRPVHRQASARSSAPWPRCGTPAAGATTASGRCCWPHSPVSEQMAPEAAEPVAQPMRSTHRPASGASCKLACDRSRAADPLRLHPLPQARSWACRRPTTPSTTSSS